MVVYHKIERFAAVTVLGCFIVGIFLTPFNPKTNGLWEQTEAMASELVDLQEEGDQQSSSIEEDCWRILEELRQALTTAKMAEFGYNYGTFEQSDQFLVQWQEAVAEGSRLRLELGDCLAKAIIGNANPNLDLSELARAAITPMFDDHRFEMTYQLAEKLDQLFPDQKDILFMKARSAFITNRFEEAARLRDLVGDLFKHLEDEEVDLFKALPRLRRLWVQEQELQAAEKAADDLPRVEFTTTEGTFVIELFENDYPDTVAHFIYLVESGHYDDMVFHRVTRNFLPMSNAETGFLGVVEASSGNYRFQPRPIGYRIADEQTSGVSRSHFRGTISMIRAFDAQGALIPNSVSGRFFIPLVPAIILDGNHLVIGRVVENIEVVDRIQSNVKTDPKDGSESPLENPGFSIILTAKVTRKRDREYLPIKVND